MKILNNYNCEKCKNKEVCKYYDVSNKYSEKDLYVKLKPKDEIGRENLQMTITCKYYKSEETVLNYPYGVRGDTVPYINTDINTIDKNPFEPHFDPNNTTGSYPMNTNIAVSNNMESDKAVNLEKSYEVIDRGNGTGYVTAPKAYVCSEHLSAGAESSRDISTIITSKKHI